MLRSSWLAMVLIGCGEPEWVPAADNSIECPDAKTSRCIGDDTAPCPAGLVCRYERDRSTAVVSCDSAVCKTYSLK